MRESCALPVETLTRTHPSPRQTLMHDGTNCEAVASDVLGSRDHAGDA